MGRVKRVVCVMALVSIATTVTAASAAAAPSFELEAEAPGTVKSTGSFKSVINGVSISCKTAHYHQEETGWWIFTKIKFRLTATGPCTMSGTIEATVNTEECGVGLTPTSTTEAGYTGTLDFECPEGQSIKMTAGTCAAEIVSQEGLTSVSFVNQSEPYPPSVLWTPEVSGMEYVVTKDGFLCPFSGTGVGTDGEFIATESAEILAFVSEEPVGIAVVGE